MEEVKESEFLSIKKNREWISMIPHSQNWDSIQSASLWKDKLFYVSNETVFVVDIERNDVIDTVKFQKVRKSRLLCIKVIERKEKVLILCGVNKYAVICKEYQDKIQSNLNQAEESILSVSKLVIAIEMVGDKLIGICTNGGLLIFDILVRGEIIIQN